MGTAVGPPFPQAADEAGGVPWAPAAEIVGAAGEAHEGFTPVASCW